MAPVSSKELLWIQCGLTLKRVRDMIKTYCQINEYCCLISDSDLENKNANAIIKN